MDTANRREFHAGPRLSMGVAAALAACVAGIAPVRAEPAACFEALGDLPGGEFESSVAGMSADGSVIIGTSSTNVEASAFRWTAAEGMVGLGALRGGSFSECYGVSADGLVVVGRSTSPSGAEAFRWTASTGMVGLGFLRGGSVESFALAASADGSVVVGSSRSAASGNEQEAFRWTESGGMVALGDLRGGRFASGASAVSADGNVIAGSSHSGSSLHFEAFRWTQAVGMVGIGDFAGGDFDSFAAGVSADGSTIVGAGSSAASKSNPEAFRWTANERLVSMGDLPGGLVFSLALAASADGSVIVGSGYAGIEQAFIWDAARGMRSIPDVLTNEFGIDLTGWWIFQATAISADGSVIAGIGLNPDHHYEAWRAVIPRAKATIIAANPPVDNPYAAGQQPFRDVLQNMSNQLVLQGIGGVDTPPEGPTVYESIEVTFDATPLPAPTRDNVAIACTGAAANRPAVTGVSGSGAGPYAITLSSPIPAGECTTLTFSGTAAGQKLQYQSQPGDVNTDAATNTQDLLTLINALRSGEASQPQNLARYNLNRSRGANPVDAQDLTRLIQLLNGVNTTRVFNGTSVADCP